MSGSFFFADAPNNAVCIGSVADFRFVGSERLKRCSAFTAGNKHIGNQRDKLVQIDVMHFLTEFGNFIECSSDMAVDGKKPVRSLCGFDKITETQAEAEVVIPDRADRHDIGIGVFVKIRRCAVAVRIFGQFIDQITVCEGLHRNIVRNPFSVGRIRAFAKKRVFKFLIIGGNIVHLVLAAIFRTFYNNIIISGRDKIAFFLFCTDFRIHFQKISAGQI